MKTADITAKELAVLILIRDSEYRSGALTDAVWSTHIDPPAGMTKRGMGGVLAPLHKKGLVSLSGSGKESAVALLAPAIELLASPAETAKPSPAHFDPMDDAQYWHGTTARR